MASSSNVYRLGIALGANAAAPQYLIDVNDTDISPKTEIQVREETGLGRDEGDSYIKVLSAGGSAKIVLRPKTAPLFVYGVLGAKASAGSGSPAVAPFTHTGTPANDQPFFTIWRFFADSIYERFTGCKITKNEFEWEAGGDVMLGLDVMGLGFERLNAPPVGGVYDNGLPFRVPGVRYTVEGEVIDTITGGKLTIEAGQEAKQTTKITNSYLLPTARKITASYDEIYQNVKRYAKVYYGSEAGLAPNETIYEGAFKFEFGDMVAGPGLSLNVPRFQFTEVDPKPNSGAEALMMPVAGKAARPVGGAPAITAKVVNDVPDYAAAA